MPPYPRRNSTAGAARPLPLSRNLLQGNRFPRPPPATPRRRQRWPTDPCRLLPSITPDAHRLTPAGRVSG